MIGVMIRRSGRARLSFALHAELACALKAEVKHLARKTICFSKSTEMHDTVIGLFINRVEFGRTV